MAHLPLANARTARCTLPGQSRAHFTLQPTASGRTCANCTRELSRMHPSWSVTKWPSHASRGVRVLHLSSERIQTRQVSFAAYSSNNGGHGNSTVGTHLESVSRSLIYTLACYCLHGTHALLSRRQMTVFIVVSRLLQPSEKNMWNDHTTRCDYTISSKWTFDHTTNVLTPSNLWSHGIYLVHTVKILFTPSNFFITPSNFLITPYTFCSHRSDVVHTIKFFLLTIYF